MTLVVMVESYSQLTSTTVKPIATLLRLRTLVSDNGRFVRFFLTFTGGQHTAFALPFNKMALFLNAIKDVVRTMVQRLAASDAHSSAEIAEGLSDALTVTSITSGRDADSGEKLLWIDTAENGSFAFHLTDDFVALLAEHLHRREDQAAE